MQFIDYLTNAQNVKAKILCPKDCEFKNREDDPIVGVPAPQNLKELRGIIISRDPTTAFIVPYMEARQKSLEDWRYQLMTAKAPPQWLLRQIEIFKSKYLNEIPDENIEQLREVMVNNVYWTHLHKCCTDKSSKDAPRFKTKNAKLCADQWLRQELSEAIEQGAKFIICVGNDAKAWVSEWEKNGGAKGIKVFYLPHPSGAANGAWNPKDDKKTEALKTTIEDLLRLCRPEQ